MIKEYGRGIRQNWWVLSYFVWEFILNRLDNMVNVICRNYTEEEQ